MSNADSIKWLGEKLKGEAMVQGRCIECTHVYDVAALPMQPGRAEAIFRDARCPMCGADGPAMTPGRYLTADERAKKALSMLGAEG